MSYVIAFAVGGMLCVLAQLVLDLTQLTPAHVMTLFVVLGGVAAAVGVYGPLVRWAQAGATIPLPGFGYTLVQGVMQEVHRAGWVGLFTGGLRATAAGIKAAIIFAFAASLLVHPRG